MTERIDWRPRIVAAVRLLQDLHAMRPQWGTHLPELAATVAEVAEAEAKLGEQLDPEYRNFLSFASGWRAFYQSVDILGAGDLLGGEAHALAHRALSFLLPEVLAEAGLTMDTALPVAVSRDDLDLFVLHRASSPTPGAIVWFAGSEVDRFDDFVQFFDSMMLYNRQALDRAHARLN